MVAGIEKLLANPALPYQNKENIPISEERERLIDIAYHFFESNRLKQDVENLCVNHLLHNFQISKKSAIQIAQLAHAIIVRPTGVCFEQITDSAVVIRKGINNRVVIPLSKLAEVAGFNEEDAQ